MLPCRSHHCGICIQKQTYPTVFPPGYEWRTPRSQAATGLPEKLVRVLSAGNRRVYIWPWLSRLKKSLTKDSTQRLFIKDYNLLDVFWGGTDEGKIENDWIGGVPFSTASAASIVSRLSNNFSILKRAGLEVEPILGANLTILIRKEFFPFPKRISRIPTLGRGAGSCSL